MQGTQFELLRERATTTEPELQGPRAAAAEPALEPVQHESSRRNEKPSPCNEA